MKSAVAEPPAIDASQVETDSLPEKPFPAGRVFRVFIADEAYQTMWEQARESLAGDELVNEVGGILVGDIFRDDSGPYLEIKAAIVAEHTRSEGTEVAFTPETWAQVNRVKDSLHPDDRIVGWYHTHPRFGIFLSERDKFIHRHSFSQPWAAAYVIDPVQNLEGLFLWSNGEPREVLEYWAGGERKLQLPRETARGEESAPAEPYIPGASRAGLLSSLAFVLAALLLSGGLYYRNEVRRAQEMQLVARALNSQQQELDRALQSFNDLQTSLDSSAQADAAHKEQIDNAVKQLKEGLRRVDELARALRGDVDALARRSRTAADVPPARAAGNEHERMP